MNDYTDAAPESASDDTARQVESLLTSGEEASRTGDAKSALAAFNKAISLDPSSDMAWFNRGVLLDCLLYTSPSPRDMSASRMPSSA